MTQQTCEPTVRRAAARRRRGSDAGSPTSALTSAQTVRGARRRRAGTSQPRRDRRSAALPMRRPRTSNVDRADARSGAVGRVVEAGRASASSIWLADADDEVQLAQRESSSARLRERPVTIALSLCVSLKELERTAAGLRATRDASSSLISAQRSDDALAGPQSRGQPRRASPVARKRSRSASDRRSAHEWTTILSPASVRTTLGVGKPIGLVSFVSSGQRRS